MKVVNERKAIALKKITDASKELGWMSKNFERPYPGIATGNWMNDTEALEFIRKWGAAGSKTAEA